MANLQLHPQKLDKLFFRGTKLGVQFMQIFLPFGLFGLDLAGKNSRGRFFELLHPLMDESLVHVKFATQLGNGILFGKNSQGHSGLERGRMVSKLGY